MRTSAMMRRQRSSDYGAFLVTERHVRHGERVVLADHTAFVETAARRIAEALVDVAATVWQERAP